MDPILRHYYEISFKAKFLDLKSRGDEFQAFFSTIMEMRYPGDFQRVRPWGKIGDKKNDGFIMSEGTFFSVHSPYNIEASKTVSKMEEDLEGALEHWKEDLEKWVFVHNGKDGNSPPVGGKLLDFRRIYPNIEFEGWGFSEIRKIVFKLDKTDLIGLLGVGPTLDDFRKLAFQNIKRVLDLIILKDPLPADKIGIVPERKIEVNELSYAVKNQIILGMQKSKLVKDYLEYSVDEEYGQKLAITFKEKYQEIKARNIEPDEIFFELVRFVGGFLRESPIHEAAVFAVLAYFFETCDIFENPLEDNIDDTSR